MSLRSTFILFILSTLTIEAFSQYVSQPSRGLISQKYTSPTGQIEECVILKPLPIFQRANLDTHIKKEAQLCNYSFYSTQSPTQVGLCPKLNSTNPGIDIYDITLREKNDFQNNTCKAKDIVEEKVAKFKQSVSCSYVPSILAYYQVGKALGNLNIPPAVIRTMDSQEHTRLRQQAKMILSTAGRSGELIYKTWTSRWDAAYQNPKSKSGNDVFTNDYKQIYGALSDNPSGELRYKEVYGRWANYDQRHMAMTALPPYKNINDSRSIEQMIGRTLSESALQTLVQMRDVSDMLILDYLLGQWDRPGNIHFIEKLYMSQDGLNWQKMKYSKYLKDPTVAQASKYKFRIKEMILKDNDCGIVKGNATRNNKLLSQISHISPVTYSVIVRLDQEWNNPTIKNLVKSEWLLTESDHSTIGKDLASLSWILRSRCQNGSLKLDLDIEKHFSGAAHKSDCAVLPNL